MYISEIKKQAKIHCCAFGCGNKPVVKLGGLCPKHYARKRREIDPVGVRYNQWKQKAKQRGKFFDVTLKEFREFCEATGYCIVKGRRGKNATIDRPDNKQGYTKTNMQLLTLRDNIKKYHELDKHDPDYCPF